MPKIFFAVVSLGFAYWSLLACSYIYPNFDSLFSVIPLVGLLVILPVTIVVGWKQWRLSSRYTMLSPLVCLFFLTSVFFVGRVEEGINTWRFTRNIYQYMRVVNNLKKGNPRTTTMLRNIETNRVPDLPNHIMQLEAAHCDNRTIVVKFLVASQGRIHSGYLFDDCDDPNISLVRNIKHEPNVHLAPLAENWYEYVDY